MVLSAKPLGVACWRQAEHERIQVVKRAAAEGSHEESVRTIGRRHDNDNNDGDGDDKGK